MNPVARVVSTVALAATAFFTLTAFQTLPDDAQLAIHWNADGVADGFAGREALLLLPAIFGITALLIALAIRFDPKRANIVRSAEAIGYVGMGLVLLFAVTQSAIINSGYGEAARLDHAVPIVGEQWHDACRCDVGVEFVVVRRAVVGDQVEQCLQVTGLCASDRDRHRGDDR